MIFSMPKNSLRTAVFQGSFWVFASRMFGRFLSLLSLVILSRLLEPKDIGIFGMGLLALSLLDAFTNTGISWFLIQKKDNVADYLDTAWSLQLIRSLLIFVFLLLMAPLVASFFKQPELCSLIRLLSLSVVLNGLVNIKTVNLIRELDFKTQALWVAISSASGFLISVPLVYLLRNVWALVLGTVVGQAISVLVSYLIIPHKPSFCLDAFKTREILKFSRWVTVNSISFYFIMQGDNLFVGKFLGPAFLGYYQLAFSLGNTPTSEITTVFSQVLTPAYVKLKDQKERLTFSFQRAFSLISFLSFPLAGFLFVYAKLLVTVLLGEKWLPVVAPLQVMAFSGLVRSLISTGGPLIQAFGQPKTDFYLSLPRLLIMALLIFPLSQRWGMTGVAFAVLAGMLGTFILWFKYISSTLSLRILSLLRLIALPAFACLVAFSLGYYLHSLWGFDLWVVIFVLPLIFAFYFILYLGAVYVFKVPTFFNLSRGQEFYA